MQFIGLRGSTKVYTNEHKKTPQKQGRIMRNVQDKKKTVAQYSRWYKFLQEELRENFLHKF